MQVLYDDNLGLVDFYPSSTNGVVYITEAELASNNYRRRLAKLRKVKYGDFDIKAVSLVSPAGILISFT